MRLRFFLCASVAAIVPLQISNAQTVEPAADQARDVVVVTASRREEALQDVAMAVSAFSGEDLSKLQVTSGKDLVRVTPGLSLAAPTGDSGNVVFSLRGVSLNDYGVGNEAPVAVYLDDVYQSSLGSGTALTFDLARVEVLKGPQGTLFGRNASGGLVHFVSARPEDNFGGYIDARAGSYGYSTEGAINMPISETLATRFSMSSEHVDGWIDNSIGKDGNNTNKNAARFQALYDTEFFTGLLTVRGDISNGRPQYTFQATDPSPDGGIAVVRPANVALGTASSPAFAALDDNDPYTGSVDQAGQSRRKSYGATLRLEAVVGDVDLVSITDATRTTSQFVEDSDVSPAQLYEIPSDSKTTQYSQEFRASHEGDRVSWVAGIFGFHSKASNPRSFFLYPQGVAYDSTMAQSTTSAALFGEVTYELIDTVSIVTGLRYTDESRRIDFAQDLILDVDGSGFNSPTNQRTPLFVFGPGTVGEQAEKSNSNVSGRLRLEWRPTTDLLTYAAFNRGFKSGGFNNPLTADNFTSSLMAYDPEQLDSYEIGMKKEFDNGALINANLFYYDYNDFQAFRSDGLSAFLSNIQAEIYGLDVEAAAQLTEELSVTGGLELLRVTAADVSPSGVAFERKMANAPEIAATFSLNYEREFGGGTFSANLFGRYVGSQYFDLSNAPITREPDYVVLDARLAYQVGGSGPELFLSVTNIADKVYRMYAIDVASLGFSQIMYAQPRRIAAGVRWSF